MPGQRLSRPLDAPRRDDHTLWPICHGTPGDARVLKPLAHRLGVALHVEHAALAHRHLHRWWRLPFRIGISARLWRCQHLLGPCSLLGPDPYAVEPHPHLVQGLFTPISGSRNWCEQALARHCAVASPTGEDPPSTLSVPLSVWCIAPAGTSTKHQQSSRAPKRLGGLVHTSLVLWLMPAACWSQHPLRSRRVPATSPDGCLPRPARSYPWTMSLIACPAGSGSFSEAAQGMPSFISPPR